MPSASEAGRFSFRYWVNDTTPPRVQLLTGAPAKAIWLSAGDSGSGVDPDGIKATIDGHSVTATYADGRIVIHTRPGSHKLVVQVSDYQEAKNTEDVAPITPNTTTLDTTVTVG